MCAVELLDSSVELCPLFTLDEELRNLGTPLHILGLHLPDLSFLYPSLGLGMGRSERVLGPLLLMLLECLLRLIMPHLALVVGHVLPCETDDLG